MSVEGSLKDRLTGGGTKSFIGPVQQLVAAYDQVHGRVDPTAKEVWQTMNEHVKPGQGKKRWFPSVAGIVGGLILGNSVLFNPLSSPFWVALDIFVLVLGLGFAAANVLGLAVVKYRSASNPNAYES